MNINTLIIGSGNIAVEYLKVIKSFKNFNILGIYSRNKKNLVKFCLVNNVSYFNNINEIKSLKKKIDLIIYLVSAPNLLKTLEQTKEINCVKLLEKPMGVSINQARKIYKISTKKKFFLALNRRMYESNLFVKRKLKGSLIIQIEDHINFDNIEKLGFKKNEKNNFVYSHSIHLVDYLNIFPKGKIKKISREKLYLNNKLYVYCLILYTSGDIGVYTCLYNSKAKWKVSIKDKNSDIIFQPLEQANILKQNFKPYKFIPSKDDKFFKPGIYKIIKNLKSYFEKKKYNLVKMPEALELMLLINKIHFNSDKSNDKTF